MGRIQFTGENADDVIKESQGLLKKVTLSDFDNEVVLIGRFKNKFFIVDKLDFYINYNGIHSVDRGFKLLEKPLRRKRIITPKSNITFDIHRFYEDHKITISAIVEGMVNKIVVPYTLEELYIGKSHYRAYVKGVISYLIRYSTNLTYNDIADILHYRDHAAVIHITNTILDEIELKKGRVCIRVLKELLEELKGSIKQYITVKDVVNEEDNQLD